MPILNNTDFDSLFLQGFIFSTPDNSGAFYNLPALRDTKIYILSNLDRLSNISLIIIGLNSISFSLNGTKNYIIKLKKGDVISSITDNLSNNCFVIYNSLDF